MAKQPTTKTKWLHMRVTTKEKKMVQQKADDCGFRNNICGFLMWLAINHEPMKIYAFTSTSKRKK